jgi:hypothetical protein
MQGRPPLRQSTNLFFSPVSTGEPRGVNLNVAPKLPFMGERFFFFGSAGPLPLPCSRAASATSSLLFRRPRLGGALAAAGAAAGAASPGAASVAFAASASGLVDSGFVNSASSAASGFVNWASSAAASSAVAMGWVMPIRPSGTCGEGTGTGRRGEHMHAGAIPTHQAAGHLWG